MNRIERIKSRLFQKDYYTKIEWWGENETILTSDEIRAEPLVVRKALAIEHLLRHMPAELKPDELIVGKIN
ncbi:MAG: pyruvate formate lyase family protein, partial [Butyricicoccus sp.]